MTAQRLQIPARVFASVRTASRRLKSTAQQSAVLLAAFTTAAASFGQGIVLSHAATPPAHVDRDFGKVPLSFEPNQGQIDPRVQFLSRGQGYALFLTPGEAVLEFQKSKRKQANQNAANALPNSSILRMTMVGANQNAAVIGEQQLPGTVNYFVGNDSSKWHSGVPTYRRVAYSAVYPGVDLVYYGNQRELEYDFLVSPGADPAKIALKFAGAIPKIDESGDLLLSVQGEEARFHKPVIYQVDGDRRMSVDGSYLIADGKVGFALGAYDHSKALVIDPILSYLTYIGGSTNDQLDAIAVDPSGNTYVVATTYSADYPSLNPYQSSNPGLAKDSRYGAIAVSKFNSTGTALIYSTYLSGTVGGTIGATIAVDSNGSAYVGGYTQENDYPVTAGAYLTYCNNGYAVQNGQTVHASTCDTGATSGVLTKLNPTGTALVYSTFLGGDYFNAITAVAVDGSGQAYVTGSSNSYCGVGYPAFACFPITAGSAQDSADHTATDGNFAFLTKFNAAGSGLLYSSILGHASKPIYSDPTPYAYAVAIDPSGNAYIGGNANITLYTTPGSYQPAISMSSTHAFVAKFDTVAQKLVYSTFLAGNTIYGDRVTGIAADGTGNAYVSGLTQECSFPTTAGAYQTQANNPPGGNPLCNAGFVTKLNPTGSALIWSTFLGNNASGNNNASLNALALGSDGSVYVAGQENGGGFPVVNPVQAQTDYNAKASISRLSSDGKSLLFSTTLGGVSASSDLATGIAVDALGNIFVAGQTNSFTLPITSGAFQTANKTNGGNSNTGFVARIAPTATTTTALTLPTGTVTAGQSVKFSAKITGQAGSTGTPTGTVTFLSGSTTLGSGTLDGTATATYTASSLNATTYNVTASYAGDTAFSGSVSAAQNLVVSPASATVTLTAPATATAGSSVTLSVAVTGNPGTPTGTVTFKDGTTTLSTATLASGGASYTTSALAVGTHALSVSYTGDSVFGAATSTSQNLVVSLATPAVTLNVPATALVGASVALSVAVAGTPGTPTGMVTFKDGTTTLGAATLASGAANYTTSTLAAGAHSITVSYGGDSVFGAATSAASTVTIIVPAAISFAAQPASLTIVHGSTGTIVLTGTPVGGYSGTVTFACGTLPASASCTFAPTTLTFSGNNMAASTTLTFSTSTTTAAIESLPGRTILAPVFAALILLPLGFLRKRKIMGGGIAVCLLVLGLVVGLSGCGSSPKSPTTVTTVPGIYTVPVTVTAGTAVSTINLSITVQ